MPAPLATRAESVTASAERSTVRDGVAVSIMAILCLLIVEFVAFGINAKQVGVYMDEWISFHQLYFAPHSLPNLIATFNTDLRKILRPLECLNIPVLFYFVGTKPFWYHVASDACEFISASFLFLAIARLTQDRRTALAASILFLLYPTHDVTHFAIVLWDQSVAWVFFAMSLWMWLKGLDEQRKGLMIGSSVVFLASLCEWEFALPLIVLYPLLTFLYLKPPRKFWLNKLQWVIYHAPFAILAGVFLAYRKWLAVAYKTSFPMNFELKHFLHVVERGISISFSPETVSFCADSLAKAAQNGFTTASIACLAIGTICVFTSLFFQRTDRNISGTAAHWRLVLLGAVTLLFSYFIFAVSGMHMPSITGWFDRCNSGGALGAALIIAGLAGALRTFAPVKSEQLRNGLYAAFFSGLAALLIVVNWQTAQAWITSWKAQTGLIEAIKSHRAELKSGDSLIVGDIGRYVDGVVVVDLPIELENILRTTLNDENLYGTVVSDRLVLTPNSLIDRGDGGFVFGKYRFEHMVLYSPKKVQWIRVSNRDQFVRAAANLEWTIPQSNQ